MQDAIAVKVHARSHRRGDGWRRSAPSKQGSGVCAHACTYRPCMHVQERCQGSDKPRARSYDVVVFINNYKYTTPCDQVPWRTTMMLPKKFEAIQATPTMQVRLRWHHASFDIDEANDVGGHGWHCSHVVPAHGLTRPLRQRHPHLHQHHAWRHEAKIEDDDHISKIEVTPWVSSRG